MKTKNLLLAFVLSSFYLMVACNKEKLFKDASLQKLNKTEKSAIFQNLDSLSEPLGSIIDLPESPLKELLKKKRKVPKFPPLMISLKTKIIRFMI